LPPGIGRWWSPDCTAAVLTVRGRDLGQRSPIVRRWRLGGSPLLPNLLAGISGKPDRRMSRAQASTRSFWLNGSAWGPTYENADTFVVRSWQRTAVLRVPSRATWVAQPRASACRHGPLP
jgi:hypothetical protein